MEVYRAYEKTFLWLLESNLGFRDWLRGVIIDPLYWIQGKPGSDKSTAMKFALRHPITLSLLEAYDSMPWIVAGYFFHDRGTTIQKSVRGFLRELLYQILDQKKDPLYIVLPIFSQLLDLQPSKLGQSDFWDREKLEEVLVLLGTMAKADINLCAVADALDEHDGDQLTMPGTALFIAAILILICGAVAQAKPAEHVLLAACKGHTHATVMFPLRGY